MPIVRNLVHVAVKAEQLCSGPGAITWIHVSERACRMFLEARFWCHDFTKGKRTSPGSANGTPSRTKFARILTRISMHTKNRPHWCSGVRVTARMQPLAVWHWCCER